MSAFSDYLLTLNPLPGGLSGPGDYFKLNETSGTALTNSGISGLVGAINGSVTKGQASLLPGDPTGFSMYQSKNTMLGYREDNPVLDRPILHNKFSCGCWLQLDDIVVDDFPLLYKGPGNYGLAVDGHFFRADVINSSPSTVHSANNLVVTNTPLFYAASFDGDARTFKIYANGVEVGNVGLDLAQSIDHTNTTGGGRYQIGGSDFFGTSGIHGYLQHVFSFAQGTLTEAEIQELYRRGVSVPGVEGDEAAYCFPWSRVVLAADSARQKVTIVNGTSTPIWLSRGGTAVVGAGDYLAPRGGTVEMNYTGAVSAIHEEFYGARLLSLRIE